MAFPLLGTNLGGLDEKLVIKVMEKHLTRMDIKYEVYRFNPEVSEPIFEKFKEGFMNTNIVFYAKSLGISKRAAVNIQNELKSGNLHSISDIIKLEMCGKTVLEKIYNYVLNDNNDLLKYMD